MNVSQFVVLLVVGFVLFAYVMHEFPDAKKALNSAFGCFSSFTSPLSSPVCAVIDFTGVAVVGRYVAKGLQEATSAAKGVREFAKGGKVIEETGNIAREGAEGAKVAREAAEGAKIAREAGAFGRVF